nr:helix-turn-helix transcriptional regulator [uncultured Eisenbergiella sp.]
MKKITFGDNKNIIGKNLKSIRKERHLTQGELAAKMQTFNVNIDQQMISKIENNARIVTDYELASLCYILGVDINAMLQNIDEVLRINKT